MTCGQHRSAVFLRDKIVINERFIRIYGNYIYSAYYLKDIDNLILLQQDYSNENGRFKPVFEL